MRFSTLSSFSPSSLWGFFRFVRLTFSFLSTWLPNPPLPPSYLSPVGPRLLFSPARGAPPNTFLTDPIFGNAHYAPSWPHTFSVCVQSFNFPRAHSLPTTSLPAFFLFRSSHQSYRPFLPLFVWVTLARPFFFQRQFSVRCCPHHVAHMISFHLVSSRHFLFLVLLNLPSAALRFSLSKPFGLPPLSVLFALYFQHIDF